jgi:predicted AlkP superfamily pyrophosphatase or phosphodiesterase
MLQLRICAAVAVAILVSSGAAPTPQPTAAADRYVVLVSIDGFAAYHLDNPAIDLPNIRALAAAGTKAASSETVFPSVTHPSHTTLVTGVTPREHGVVGNRVRDRRTGESFHITNLPRQESVKVPTLFDLVHRSGRKTAAFFWPETKEDSSIDDNVAEVFGGKNESADPSAVSPALLQELRTAGVPIDSYYAFYDDPFGQGAADLALTQAAAYVLVRRKPALTALHLLVTDKVQHEFGPAHYLSAAALTTADHCIGLLRDAVKAARIADRTTFVIAADHGFVTAPYEMNLAAVLADPVLDRHVRWHADSWYVFAELLPTFDTAAHAAPLEAVLARVARTPGIARIIRPQDFAALGYPNYADNPYVPGHYIIAADIDTRLVIDSASRDTTKRLRPQPYHGHGYLPDHPNMYPALVLSGAGVAAGHTMGHVRNVDVAPTIAAILGLEMTGVSGRVLREALR